MFSGIASISLSSALWLTAMASNPLGAELARQAGVEIAFGSWLVASSVPTLTAMLLMPLLLRRCIGPEVHETPSAPAEARARAGRAGTIDLQREGRARRVRRHGGVVGGCGHAVDRFHGGGVPGPGGAAAERRLDARASCQGRRRARDLHLVRGAVCACAAI